MVVRNGASRFRTRLRPPVDLPVARGSLELFEKQTVSSNIERHAYNVRWEFQLAITMLFCLPFGEREN